MSSGEKEIFNVGKLQSKMKELDNLFSEFAKVLKDIDEKIADNVNVETGAFMGDVIGNKFLKLWENNSSSFNEFYDNFDSWSQLIYSIASTNSELEAEVESIYKGTMAKGSSIEEKMKFVAETGAVATGGLNSDKNPSAAPDTNVDPNSGVPVEGNPECEEQETAETVEPLELKSGAAIKDSNGVFVRFYGSYRNPDGSLENIYVNNKDQLYTLDSSGNPVFVTVSGYPETKVTSSFVNSPSSTLDGCALNEGYGVYSVKIGGEENGVTCRLLNTSDGYIMDNVYETVEYKDASKFNNGTVMEGETESFFVPSDANVSVDYRDTFLQSADGVPVNSYINKGTDDEMLLLAPSQMTDFGAFANAYGKNSNDKPYMVALRQGLDVQWDPSNGCGNGYDFHTSDGAQYLKFVPEDQCYYRCDSYGNVTNNMKFTVDGFNDHYGHFK